MKGKKLLSIICAVMLTFFAGITLADAKEAFAAEGEKVNYYYGTTLASVGDGSSIITSSLADGLQITFGKASKDSSASYKHALYMNDLAVAFTFTNANFGEFWIRFTDNDNDTKWVEIYLSQEGDNVAYQLKDNYKNETEKKTSSVAFTALSDAQQNATLSYKDNKFSLNGNELDSVGIETLSFYKNIAKMSFGVKNVDGSSNANDAVIRFRSIKNSSGEQSLVTANSKFEGEARKAPVVIPMADGDDAAITSQQSVDLTAASNAEFTLPYYCIDTLGTGWYASVQEGTEAEGEKVLAKTKHALGAKDQTYTFKIYPLYSDETPLVTVNVTAKDDVKAVSVNDEAFMTFLREKMQQNFNDNHIVAPSEGNTFEFPHIYRENFGTIFSAADALDSFDNVKIQVGYRAPNDSGEYSYAAAYAVKINATGRWSFRYKVTDSAGNKTETQPFDFLVFDEDAPTISVSSSVEISVNEGYSIPSASITDNASGVDSAYSKWTLYRIKNDGTREEIKNLKEGENGFEDNLLKNGTLTPKELTPSDKEASFVVVYEARDNAGNIAQTAEMRIKVVEGTPEYVNNPWNDFFRIALIVLACLSGVGIIVLIFLRPRKHTDKADKQ